VPSPSTGVLYFYPGSSREFRLSISLSSSFLRSEFSDFPFFTAKLKKIHLVDFFYFYYALDTYFLALGF